MKRLHRFTPGAALFAVLLALLLTAAGCSSLSDNSPTAPGDTGTATTSSDTYAESFIRADQGGWLVLGANRVYFPPGALSGDTVVSILRVEDTTVFDFSPDGVQFNKPVSLTIEMAPAGGFGAYKQFVFPAIYYWNPGTSRWERIGGFPDYSNRTVTAQIEHFSRYGTATPHFH